MVQKWEVPFVFWSHHPLSESFLQDSGRPLAATLGSVKTSGGL